MHERKKNFQKTKIKEKRRRQISDEEKEKNQIKSLKLEFCFIKITKRFDVDLKAKVVNNQWEEIERKKSIEIRVESGSCAVQTIHLQLMNYVVITALIMTRHCSLIIVSMCGK
jgi:hypothetical protein